MNRKKPAAKKKPAIKITPQMMRIVSTMLDKVELVLDALAPKPLPDDRDSVQRSIGRWTNNLMALWRQCDKPACRRARRCRGLPTGCLLARAPKVPPEVLTGAHTMLDGRRHSLDDLDLRAGARNDVAAVKAWLGQGFPASGQRHNLALHSRQEQTALASGR